MPKQGEECLLDTLPAISPEIAVSPHYASAKYTTIDEDEYDKLDKKEQDVIVYIYCHKYGFN